MPRSARLHALRRRAHAAARSRLGVDRRALAALRVALGLVLLVDLALRSRTLVAFYTDAGVYPRAAYLSTADPLHLSIHTISGAAWAQAALFVLAAAFAAALTVGYRTRPATLGSWLLLVSLHNRMPGVLNGGDVLLRLLLFWALFLPLGARWSVDARHAGRAGAGAAADRVVNVATAALLVQVVLVYAVNAAFKLQGPIWLRGDGLAYVFSLGQFTVLLGDVLGSYPALLVPLDYLWLAAVAGSPLLLVLRGRWRAGYVALLVGMHVGMAFTVRIGIFPLVSIASLLPFLPAAVWDAASSRLGDARPVAALRRWHARLAEALPTVRVGDGGPALRRWATRARTVVVLAVLVLVVLWNVQVLLPAGSADVVPAPGEAVLDLTRTDQYWNMFAPDPLAVDGWLVAPGDLANGTTVDAFHGGAVRWDRPPDVSATYPTARWRKYVAGLWRYNSPHRHYFAEYLCRSWNRDHAVAMERVRVYYVEQPTRLDGPEPTERVHFETHRCGSG